MGGFFATELPSVLQFLWRSRIATGKIGRNLCPSAKVIPLSTSASRLRGLAMGYAAGAFPPCRTSFSDFLKAAHTLALAQGQAHRAAKAASSKATVGSAYEMAPAYPKTDSEDDRAATARYHAMNNVFFLEAAMKGRYPKAFVGDPPYEVMILPSGICGL